MARRIFLLLLLVVTHAPAIFASTAVPDSLLTFPVIDVRARRLEAQELLDRRAGTATVLHRSSWTDGTTSAASVLARAAGVSVREQGGLGSYSTVAVRGTSTQQVPIFLDGVPLNHPAHGTVNLADVPLVALDRIEVYRGAAPLVMGGASPGGAIHLHTARAAGTWVTAGTGSFGTRSVQMASSAAAGAWLLMARAQGARSDNDWEFLDDNGTLYNPDDDARVRRANNDVRGGSLFLSAQRPWRDWTVSLTQTLDGREQGSPGHSVLQSRTARDRTLTHQLQASLLRRSGRIRSLTAYHRHHRQSFYDPDGDLTRTFSDRHDAVHALGLNATGGSADRGRSWWRAEMRIARLRSEDSLQELARGEPQSRLVLAGAVQPSLPLSERFTLTPGLGVEWHHDRFHGVPEFGSLPQGPVDRDVTMAPVFQLGGVLRLGPETFLKASLGHTTRPPTLLERFGVRGAVAGNPDLRPERSMSRDLSLVWSRPERSRRLALSIFDNDLWDLITYQRVSAAHARAANLGRASSRGVEVEMALGAIGPVHWRQDFTLLTTRDRTDDKVAGGSPLPGRPGLESRTEVALRLSRGSLAYELTSVGHNYLQTGRRERVAGRTLHGLHARWRLTTYVTLAVGARNLADQESYDLAGYPLPGRTLYATVITGGGDADR